MCPVKLLGKSLYEKLNYMYYKALYPFKMSIFHPAQKSNKNFISSTHINLAFFIMWDKGKQTLIKRHILLAYRMFY